MEKNPLEYLINLSRNKINANSKANKRKNGEISPIK